jgi:hypothetical protein
MAGTRTTDKGQADKAQVEEATAAHATASAQPPATVEVDSQGRTEDQVAADDRRHAATSAAAKALGVEGEPDPANPFPNYDVMTLEQLREVAKARNVEINRDVERAHLITELRAADTGARPTLRTAPL